MKFKNKILSGWSNSNFSNCNYFEAETKEQIADCFEFSKKNKKLVCFRGGGRSYGDNTLNKNNIVLKYKPTQNIISFDEIKGEITVSGNCNLVEILKFSIPKGWLLYVSPGSQYVTISGAISNNVHGKNCSHKGYFGDYVKNMEVFTPDKGLLTCSKEKNSDLYFSVISGLGAFGLIVNATIKLRKIKTILINTNTNYVKSLEHTVESFEKLTDNFEFNIGSLNFTRFSKNLNDGKVYSSNFSEDISLEESNSEARIIIYLINYCLLFNKLPLFNKMIEYCLSKVVSKKLKETKKIIENYYSMNFLGDTYLPLYNHFFRNGFIEYQVIFDKKNYLKGINEIYNVIRSNGHSSYMSSFKSYKASDEKYIFGLNKNGYCLTFDIPHQKSLKFDTLIRKINEITIKYNGQVYFGKTPCVNNEEFKKMYKNYKQFEVIKKNYDSNFIIVSEMTNRFFSDVYNHNNN